LAGKYSLSVTADSTTTTYKELVQYYASDWDFMVSRADANGMLVIANDGALSVKKPDTSLSPVLLIQYGDTLLTFEGEVDARNQYAGVQATTWDPQTQQNIQVNSQSPGL